MNEVEENIANLLIKRIDLDKRVNIVNDDCFNVFDEIPEKSIDCIIVDLPYNQTNCKWDSKIDLEKMWVSLKRICKKNCNYIFFATTRFGYTIIKSNPKWFRYDLVWKKSKKVGFLNANKQPLRQHEMIYIFRDSLSRKKVKKETLKYNPQKTKGTPYTISRNSIGELYKSKDKKHITINKGDRHPSSVIDVETLKYNPQKTTGHKKFKRSEIDLTNSYYRGGKREYKILRKEDDGTRHSSSILEYKNPHKTKHRTQKPTELIDFLVKSYSNKDDLILDFTAGSGSTGISCIRNNRKVILIEKDEDIFKVCKNRIETYIKKDYSYDKE